MQREHAVSRRLEARVRRDFAGDSADDVLARLGGLQLALAEKQSIERIHAAVVFLAVGDLDKFEDAVLVAETDWRDVLVASGLSFGWVAHLDEELGSEGATMTPNLDRLLEFVRNYTEAWCSQDPARVAEHYAPEGSLTINGGTPAVGRASITEVARSFMTAFPDMRVLMDDLRVQDGSIEYHWMLVGTNTGPGGTGNAVQISGFEDWAIGADGLIAASLGTFDQVEYDRQLEHGVE